MLRNAFNAYNRALNSRPVITQCVTTGKFELSSGDELKTFGNKGFLMAAGDVIAQKVVEKQKIMNWKRTAKFTVFGACFIVGPPLSLNGRLPLYRLFTT